jgi:hypothetical protein
MSVWLDTILTILGLFVLFYSCKKIMDFIFKTFDPDPERNIPEYVKDIIRKEITPGLPGQNNIEYDIIFDDFSNLDDAFPHIKELQQSSYFKDALKRHNTKERRRIQRQNKKRHYQ